MELVSRLAHEPWTDRPACVHPVLSAVARAAHDHASSAGRRTLLPFAPQFVDTARTGFEPTARLVAVCVATALTSGELTRAERDRLAGAHQTALYLLGSADEPGGLARWWLPLLGRFGRSEPFYRAFVAPEQVAEAIAVTARVANGDRDVRLRSLVKQCLSVHGALRPSYGALRPGAPTPS
jgi:hypothetical protein